MTSKESPTPSDGSSNSTTRILRSVGFHPTRGVIHATAFLRKNDHAKERGRELRQSLEAQGCKYISDIIATRVEEHQVADIMLRIARQRVRDRARNG